MAASWAPLPLIFPSPPRPRPSIIPSRPKAIRIFPPALRPPPLPEETRPLPSVLNQKLDLQPALLAVLLAALRLHRPPDLRDQRRHQSRPPRARQRKSQQN